MRTDDLTGSALDWAVAIALGIPAEELRLPQYKGDGLFRYMRDEDGNLTGSYMTGPDLLFSRKWEAAGPIIDTLGINLALRYHPDVWDALIKPEYYSTARPHTGVKVEVISTGPTPIVAAMRCYVKAKLGDTVVLPKKLKY